MFAPHPPTSTWWHILEGHLSDGETIDILANGGMFHWQGSALSFDPPKSVADDYGSHRWFKYWEILGSHEKREHIRMMMTRFVCKKWNNLHPDQKLMHVKLHYEQLENHLNGTRTRKKSLLLWDSDCPLPHPETRQEPFYLLNAITIFGTFFIIVVYCMW